MGSRKCIFSQWSLFCKPILLIFEEDKPDLKGLLTSGTSVNHANMGQDFLYTDLEIQNFGFTKDPGGSQISPSERL